MSKHEVNISEKTEKILNAVSKVVNQPVEIFMEQMIEKQAGNIDFEIHQNGDGKKNNEADEERKRKRKEARQRRKEEAKIKESQSQIQQSQTAKK